MEEKREFYLQLTTWAEKLEGELLMGGDWNMTIGQKDQKLKRFNVNKNKPLKELDEKLGTRDVWRKLHQGDNMEFTWRKGDGMAQEKWIDGFRTNNK